MLINPKWVLAVIHEHEESVCKKNPRKLRLDPSETRGVRGIIVAKLIVIKITCKFYAKKYFLFLQLILDLHNCGLMLGQCCLKFGDDLGIIL